MKGIVFALLLLLGISAPVFSQDHIYTATSDTLTNTDTVVLALLPTTKAVLNSVWSYSIMVVGNNISGTTNVDCHYEFSLDGNTWYTTGSLSANAGNNYTSYDSASYLGGRYFRMRCISAGTQVSRIRVFASFKKRL